MDCPEDIETYIHRVGRTARFTNEGRSVLFLSPSEFKMLEKLQGAEPKIPIKSIKVTSNWNFGFAEKKGISYYKHFCCICT